MKGPRRTSASGSASRGHAWVPALRVPQPYSTSHGPASGSSTLREPSAPAAAECHRSQGSASVPPSGQQATSGGSPLRIRSFPPRQPHPRRITRAVQRNLPVGGPKYASSLDAAHPEASVLRASEWALCSAWRGGFRGSCTSASDGDCPLGEQTTEGMGTPSLTQGLRSSWSNLYGRGGIRAAPIRRKGDPSPMGRRSEYAPSFPGEVRSFPTGDCCPGRRVCGSSCLRRAETWVLRQWSRKHRHRSSPP